MRVHITLSSVREGIVNQEMFDSWTGFVLTKAAEERLAAVVEVDVVQRPWGTSGEDEIRVETTADSDLDPNVLQGAVRALLNNDWWEEWRIGERAEAPPEIYPGLPWDGGRQTWSNTRADGVVFSSVTWSTIAGDLGRVSVTLHRAGDREDWSSKVHTIHSCVSHTTKEEATERLRRYIDDAIEELRRMRGDVVTPGV